MAEADLHAEEAGGDFAGEAERLGEAVAEVHADLATAFGTREASADELRERAAAMHGAARRAPSRSCRSSPQVAAGLAARPTTRSPRSAESVTSQRIHGDLHLGQALRTVTRWVLIDFEGEPMAAIEARREFDSPLRDVAGMLRSFDYAGHHRVIEAGYDPQLELPRRRVVDPQPRRVLRRLRRRRPGTTRASTTCCCAHSRPTRPSTRRCTRPATGPAGCRSRWPRWLACD